MRRHRTLITSPLEWQMTALPVAHPALPVVAERGGTQLRAPKPVAVIDTREQNPFSFARFQGWFAGVEKSPLPWATTASAASKMSASSNAKT
jgi:hypothetical protein